MTIQKVSFVAPPVLEYLQDRKWLVHEPFKAWVTNRLQTLELTVPRLFETDLASIPRALWSVMPPEGNYLAAAVVHDYLYRLQGRTPQARFFRSDADAVLLAGMKACGVNPVERNTIWLGVRAGGWYAWGKKTIPNV